MAHWDSVIAKAGQAMSQALDNSNWRAVIRFSLGTHGYGVYHQMGGATIECRLGTFGAEALYFRHTCLGSLGIDCRCEFVFSLRFIFDLFFVSEPWIGTAYEFG